MTGPIVEIYPTSFTLVTSIYFYEGRRFRPYLFRWPLGINASAAINIFRRRPPGVGPFSTVRSKIHLHFYRRRWLVYFCLLFVSEVI
jgi:hypothetical protein